MPEKRDSVRKIEGDQTLGELAVYEDRKLCIRTYLMNGRRRLSLRFFFKEGDSWFPTKQGVDFNAEHAPKVIEWLQKGLSLEKDGEQGTQDDFWGQS